MRRIYWDTMIHAYWLEDHKKLSHRVQQIYTTMLQRNDILCSSIFVVSELLVGPLRTQDTAAADLIEQYFNSAAIILLPYTQQAIRTFAELRARHGIKSLDALHLAIAATQGVDLFLTNDRRLHKLAMPGIPFVATLETDLY